VDLRGTRRRRRRRSRGLLRRRSRASPGRYGVGNLQVSALFYPTLTCPALLCSPFASYHAMSSLSYYIMSCSLLPGLYLSCILAHSTSHSLPGHPIERQPSHSYAPARLVLTPPYPTLPYLTLPYLTLPGIILSDTRQTSPSNLHPPSIHPIYLHPSSFTQPRRFLSLRTMKHPMTPPTRKTSLLRARMRNPRYNLSDVM
jgi:hypothetical protein